jgi:Trp operon repressor
MAVRPDVAELLRAGHGDRTIARQVGVSIGTVTRARAELGLPKARGGFKAAGSVEDFFWRRAKPVDGGHIEWTGHRNGKGTPTIHWNGNSVSALRVAYMIRAGREPIGYAHVTCQHPGCIAPACVADSAVTPRRGHHRSAAGRKPTTSREQIAAELKAGHSDRHVSRLYGVNTARVARIRAELGLPVTVVEIVPFEDRWSARTEPTDDGHVRWVGRERGDRPVMRHEGRDRSARRAVFEHLHSREAVGPVLPGCGWRPCVKPEHLEDEPMRQQLATQYEAIFGAAS